MYCTNGDILGFLISDDIKSLYLFKNSEVVGYMNLDIKDSPFKWDTVRPCLSIYGTASLRILGFKSGFYNCQYRGSNVLSRCKTISSKAEIPIAIGNISNHVKFCQRYLGYWSRGVPHGFGILYLPGGKTESWKGNWINGKMNGVFEHSNLENGNEILNKNMYATVLGSLNYKIFEKEFYCIHMGNMFDRTQNHRFFEKALNRKVREALNFIDNDVVESSFESEDAVDIEINGSYNFSFDKLFVFDPSSVQGGVDLSDDLQTAKYAGGSKGFVLGNRGFQVGFIIGKSNAKVLNGERWRLAFRIGAICIAMEAVTTPNIMKRKMKVGVITHL